MYDSKGTSSSTYNGLKHRTQRDLQMFKLDKLSSLKKMNVLYHPVVTLNHKTICN